MVKRERITKEQMAPLIKRLDALIDEAGRLQRLGWNPSRRQIEDLQALAWALAYIDQLEEQ